MLFVCYRAGLVELHSWKPQLTPKPGNKPLASPLARLQSVEGDLITTLRHDQVWMRQEVNRKLLQLLDGTRDRSMILYDLERELLPDQTVEAADPQKERDTRNIIDRLKTDLHRCLEGFARLGLLIS